MLRFIAGRAGTGKTYTVLRSAVAEAAEHKMTYIIVPEQSTLSYEKQLIEYNAEARRLGVEVLSFTRMVEKVMLVTGGLAGNYIDSIGKTALVYRAIRDCRDSLRLFGVSADDPKFAVRIADTADELKINNVSPEALLEAAKTESIGDTLRDKLCDTALIVGEYERLISGSFFDPVDKLTALCEILDGFDFFAGCAVYIDGFTGFTVQEEKVIESMIRQSSRCVISLSAPSDAFGEEIFYPIASMAKRFRDFAEANGVEVGETEILTVNRKFESDTMKQLESGLYAGAEVDGGEEISLYKAADPYDEMRYVASEIKRLVAENGCRYRDFAVVAGDLEECRSAAEIEFEQYRIPYFVDSRRDVRFKPLMRLVSFAFRAASRGMFYEDMADLAKTGLAGPDFEQTALLENYINLWRVSGRKWESAFTLNPRGFSESMTDADRETLAAVNEAREKLARPLLLFKDRVAAASTADDYAAAIYDYLEAAGAPEVIRAERAAAAAAGEEYDGDRMWDLLMDVLDRVSSAMGDEPLSADNYADLLRLLFENADVGVIPPHADEVIIGSEGRVRVEHIKYCFIVGATDGNFPRPFGAKGVFTNADKEELLRDCAVPLIHDEETRRCELMLSAYNALTIPSRGVSVSYSATETAVGVSAPSPAILELRETFKKCRRLSAADLKYEDVCGSPAAALETCVGFFGAPETPEQAAVCSAVARVPELAERLESYRALRENADGPLEADAAGFVAEKTDTVSATKTESYVSCPFKFFCQYGLSLRGEAKTELDGLTVGSFIHYVLERVVKAVTEDAAEGGTKAYIARIVDEYVENCLGGRENLPESFLNSIARTTELIAELVENVQRELEASGYKPVDFELEIGGEGVEPWRISAAGGAMSFEGKIDRVDFCERGGKKYLRIIDYKSGGTKKEFSLGNVYDGLDIQMLVYLIAIWLNGSGRYGEGTLPAGVFYFPANRKLIKADGNFDEELRSANALSGIALEDSPVDAGVPEKSMPQFYTMEQLELLKKHIEKLMREMRVQLSRGLVPKSPSAKSSNYTSCTYCDYAAVCGVDFDDVEYRRLGKTKDVFGKLREEYGDE